MEGLGHLSRLGQNGQILVSLKTFRLLWFLFPFYLMIKSVVGNRITSSLWYLRKVTMKSRLVLLLCSICLTLSLVDCGVKPQHPSPQDCQTAAECTRLLADPTPATCTDNKKDSTYYSLINNHLTRKVRVNYEEKVRHLNSTRPNEQVSRTVLLEPRQTTPLGCRYTKGFLSEQFDEWTYSSLQSCFDGECPAITQKPGGTRDPKTTYEELCDRQDKSCFVLELANTPNEKKLGDALAQLTISLANRPIPVQHSMDEFAMLANTYMGTNTCQRTPLTINQTNEVATAGTTCRVGAGTPNDSLISEFEFSLDGEILGDLERSSSSNYRVSFKDLPHSPWVKLQERQGNRPVIEHVIGQSGQPNQLTLTGEKYYCARLKWAG